MSPDIRIETERLVMRQFNADDIDGMWLMNGDEEVMRYTGDNGFTNKEEVAKLISEYDQYSKYKMGRLTLLLKSTGEYIGWCGLKYNSDIDEVNLGYRLIKKYWLKGFATESSVASLNYGFDDLKLLKIIARADKRNVGSLKVIKKLGMLFEKEFLNNKLQWEQYFTLGEHWKRHRIILDLENK